MAELKTEGLTVNFGPQHPSTHGVLVLRMVLDGELVIGAEPLIGYLTRTIEKIFENRTYLQGIAITDRLDYLSGVQNELAFILPIEKLMDIDVPERAQYIRVITSELYRISSHLLSYGTFGLDAGAISPFVYSFREREKILDIIEMAMGYRLHPNYFRVGGVKEDVTDEFLKYSVRFCEELPGWLEEYNGLLTGNEIFQMRTRKVGKISQEFAINAGITGPLLRSTGLKWDLRKDDPYSIYDRFDFDVPVGEEGSCFDAYFVRLREMAESAKIILQAISKLPDGPVRAKVPFNVRPPAGEAFARIESSRGEFGVYMVSDGSDRPYRAKVRAPSFMNLAQLPEMLKGWLVADSIVLIGAFDPVMGEVDR